MTTMPRHLRGLHRGRSIDAVVQRALRAGWVRVTPGTPAAQQFADGYWWGPRFGCESLAETADHFRAEILNILSKIDQ